MQSFRKIDDLLWPADSRYLQTMTLKGYYLVYFNKMALSFNLYAYALQFNSFHVLHVSYYVLFLCPFSCSLHSLSTFSVSFFYSLTLSVNHNSLSWHSDHNFELHDSKPFPVLIGFQERFFTLHLYSGEASGVTPSRSFCPPKHKIKNFRQWKM